LDAPIWLWATFLFIFGCCIGSFLNVVIWRLPRGGSIARPANSYCPACEKPIAWYDNIPLLSWVILRAKCRKCGAAISIRYPLIELSAGLLFLGLFLAVFAGPMRPDLPGWPTNWPAYLGTVVLVCGLLAASVIDLEHYFIPLSVVWTGGLAGVALATIFPERGLPVASADASAWAVGGSAGLLVSMLLLRLKVLPLSFPDEQEVPQDKAARKRDKLEQKRRERREKKKGQPAPGPKREPGAGQSVGATVGVRREILKEVLFLLPVIAGAVIWARMTRAGTPLGGQWSRWCESGHVAGLGGALFGLLIGGGVIWAVRILGSLGFGREAMGLGDVHLMAAAGAVIGWAGATIAFFVAPFFGLLIGVIQLVRRGKREMPYGPYLTLGILVVIATLDCFVRWLGPGFEAIFLRAR
jgi:leader peptidase (prepilin peptidase)/N-methyltransferase